MRRRKRIVQLEQALRSALGREGSSPAASNAPASGSARSEDIGQRLDAARRQLKATVPPPQD